MILWKRSKKLTQSCGLLGLTLLLVALSGCSLLGKKVTLYPIQPTDFYVLENGNICMSEFWFNEVLQVELEAK